MNRRILAITFLVETCLASYIFFGPIGLGVALTVHVILDLIILMR